MSDQSKLFFFALLRNALWHSGEDMFGELTEELAGRILRCAEKQAVLALVIDSLIRNDVRMPRQQLFDSIGALEQIKQDNRSINDGVRALHRVMTDANVDFVIVKGQAVGSYYLDPLLRQSGDIDYYCDGQNFPKAQQAIKKAWDIKADREGSEHHVHFVYQGVTYEGHFALASFYDKAKDRYWRQLLGQDKGTAIHIDGVPVRTLSPTSHALFVFVHLYHHLMELGVGLRQFCDLAVLLHYCKRNIDLPRLRLHLSELGMERAYRACGCILTDYLGLPENELGYTLTDKDRGYGRKILDVVFYRGNMGHYNKRNGFKGWKHKVEATGIKASHFVKFMPLAPGYSCRWLWHEFWRKIYVIDV